MSGIRIAMWSGPRNISTALMRSWGSRRDTFVTDEPFYAHYLRETGIEHPGREEILEACPDSWETIADWLIGPIPGGSTIWYQKQMSHHLLPEMIGPWLDHLTHAFLIRDPAAVIVSFSRVVEEPVLSDLGLEQQVAIFERVREKTGSVPPVVDSDDLLRNPREMLQALCERLGVPFDDSMLQWAPGPRETDGIWARHWYQSVERSTGFQPWKRRDMHLDDCSGSLAEQALPYYEALSAHKLTI